MTRRRLRPLALLAGIALALPLAACGREKTTTVGLNEGTYIDVGPMTYQVQISRQLNPRDVEDRAYLAGVVQAQAKLAPDQVWFAVFMRVQNTSDRTEPAASQFVITDTLDDRFAPVAIAKTNPFAYRPRDVAPGQLLPSASSAAGSAPVGQGSVLVFKIKLSSLGNRPLELHIFNPKNQRAEGKVDLDV